MTAGFANRLSEIRLVRRETDTSVILVFLLIFKNVRLVSRETDVFVMFSFEMRFSEVRLMSGETETSVMAMFQLRFREAISAGIHRFQYLLTTENRRRISDGMRGKTW